SCDRRFGAFCLARRKAERVADCHTQPADALFIVYYQQSDFKVVAHGLPKVFSTMEISCCTRNGFSMQGVPLRAKSACVSLLAVSPLIKMIRDFSSGRFR